MSPAAPAPPPALPLRVQVPCSTSNLGPGFDLLGLALSLPLEVRLVELGGGSAHEVVWSGPTGGEDAGFEPDLLPRAFGRAADELGIAGAFRFEARSSIPVGRGFGSSGAAVAAGLVLAAALAPREIDPEVLLAWGIELEGHPDNVTASLFGGCTLCHPDPDGRPAHIAASIDPTIGFALAWPATPLATEEARRALPDQVPRADAVENPRRLVLLLEGLRTASPRLLAIGGEDRLHVRHRLELIPGAAAGITAAREAGAWLATISGAGSGLVALGPKERMPAIAAAMDAAFRTVTPGESGGGSAVVEPVFGAPVVSSYSGGA